MKAIRYHEHGGPDVLKLEEVPDPVPAPGEALVEIRGAGINRLDLFLRGGLPGIKVAFPRIPCADGAGVVLEVNGEGGRVQPGDRVLCQPFTQCGHCEFCAAGTGSLCLNYNIYGEHSDGMAAERVAVPVRNLHRIPDAMSFEEAAAAPLALLTAWRMLMGRGRIRPGDDVLVLAGGAGVGIYCVQIAKHAGCRVISTAGSDAKCGKLRELGADVVFNHTTQDFAREIRSLTNKRGVDVVIDYVGKATWARSLLAVRRGGKIVTCGATTGYDPVEDLRHIFYRQLEILGSTMGSEKDFSDSMKVFLSGKVRSVVDRAVPFSKAAEAHRALEAREVFGKVVLVPGG